MHWEKIRRDGFSCASFCFTDAAFYGFTCQSVTQACRDHGAPHWGCTCYDPPKGDTTEKSKQKRCLKRLVVLVDGCVYVAVALILEPLTTLRSCHGLQCRRTFYTVLRFILLECKPCLYVCTNFH